jgi:hypothetical protein
MRRLRSHSRRGVSRPIGRSVLLIGLVVLVLGVGHVSASAGSATSAAACTAVGPKYTYAGHSTTKYRIALAGVGCAFAKAWVPRLAVKVPFATTDPSGYKIFSISLAPPGWRCTAYDPHGLPAKPKRAYAGACVPTVTARKKFAWGPAI